MPYRTYPPSFVIVSDGNNFLLHRKGMLIDNGIVQKWPPVLLLGLLGLLNWPEVTGKDFLKDNQKGSTMQVVMGLP